MGSFGVNPWFARYVRRVQRDESPARMSLADALREIDGVAAEAWERWTPEQSMADEFKARFMSSLLAYYRRRPLV
jgi:hypothetical protein